MRSEIIGEFEKTVQPTVEMIRAPAIVGLDVSFAPEGGKALADLIERLAQTLDAERARAEMNAKTRGSVVLGLLVFASLFLLGHLFN